MLCVCVFGALDKESADSDNDTDEAYFHALDLIFSAMNADKDFDKDYLESRINCHLLKLGLSPVKSDDNGSGWRDAVIESTIAVAVAAKKSKVGKQRVSKSRSIAQ